VHDETVRLPICLGIDYDQRWYHHIPRYTTLYYYYIRTGGIESESSARDLTVPGAGGLQIQILSKRNYEQNSRTIDCDL